jgi:hypothetical protein
MLDSRKKMLERVRAILSKTMENGCTEGEAMAALAKARELMATYEIDENDLKVEQVQEGATIYKGEMNDPYEIKRSLSFAVGRFTRCRVWRGTGKDEHKYGVAFCGLESDVIFATWLLETLRRFVMRALREFQKERAKNNIPNSNFTSASFVIGCAQRIADKLKELTPVEPIVGTGNALTVSRQSLIAAKLAESGIVLQKGRKSSRDVDRRSYNKGQNAGNSARFDRPVNQGGRLMLK